MGHQRHRTAGGHGGRGGHGGHGGHDGHGATAAALRRSGCAPRRLVLVAAAGFASSGPVTVGKHVEDSVSLRPGEAKVVTKFCFDYNKDCSVEFCPPGTLPGMLDATFYAARRTDGQAAGTNPKPEVFLALLDDEYFSFPEVSQVWGDINCTEVQRAAKKTFPLDWDRAASPEGFTATTRLVERLRPRWWYIAVVSCAPVGVEMSYRMHMQNTRQGSQSEMSMDAVGVGWAALVLFLLFGMIAKQQLASAGQWADAGAPGGDFRGRSKKLLRLHPAVGLLTVATLLAAAGEGAWALHFYDLQTGAASLREHWLGIGRCLRLAAKTCLSALLLLLSRGQVVCTPDVAWDEHRELLTGLIVFGVLSFGLETWGDSELRTTTTEYIYDTKPGMALVAFDLLWLWLYISRCMSTWQAETRIKPRTFYRLYGLPMALWFASLPLVALLAALLDAWVRFKVTFAIDGLVHAAALAVLVHTFQPSVASGLYELSAHEYQPVNRNEELDQVIRDDDFI